MPHPGAVGNCRGHARSVCAALDHAALSASRDNPACSSSSHGWARARLPNGRFKQRAMLATGSVCVVRPPDPYMHTSTESS